MDDRPDWLTEGMDPDTSFNLEIRIVSPNCPGRWFMLDKVIDADVTNFRDLVDGVVDKYPCGYGDIVRLFYFCMDRKVNIEVCSDQDLVEMFAKHKASKCCLLTLAYHSPSVSPAEIPDWDFSSTSSVQPPMTPSVACPSLAEPSHATHTQPDETECLTNPNPMNEHVGVDEEGLYIDVPLPNPLCEVGSKQMQDEILSDESVADESLSDEETEVDDRDDIIKDRQPEQMPDFDYDKKDPPMTEGTVYSNMAAFKCQEQQEVSYHYINLYSC